jgi:Protein of unknown function (DUF2800)
MSSAHARLGPSSSSRWIQCTASIRLSENLPESVTGPAAAAGTLMHAVFERLLLNQGHLTTEEIEELSMLDVGEQRARLIIDQGVQAARQTLAHYRLSEFITEVRVNPGHRIGRDDFWGTADLVAADAQRRILMVGDLKTGRGRVDVRLLISSLIEWSSPFFNRLCWGQSRPCGKPTTTRFRNLNP